MKNQIMSCEFNIGTVCVEVKLTDGCIVSIDCDTVENEYAHCFVCNKSKSTNFLTTATIIKYGALLIEVK